MAKRDKGIIAYGTEDDRRRLAVLAGLSGQSVSEWIITRIRDDYRVVFGESDPALVLAATSVS